MDEATGRRERRRHVVYLTKNSEYHCRSSECVAVRDRRTGHWHREHQAVRGLLIGAVDAARRVRSNPDVGDRLFIDGEKALLTSRIQVVGRPDRTAVFAYSSQTWSGVIE